MPFTLEVTARNVEQAELCLRGRVQSGAYFGPERVSLRSADGREYEASVRSHEIIHPVGWPVLPEHQGTELVLRVAPIPPATDIVHMTGLGVIELGSDRVDVSEVLTDPGFWAYQLSVHFATEEVDDPALEWLGVSSDEADHWYDKHIQAPVQKGVWPYVRVSLPRSRYIELEMAGGVEHQDRVWIGDVINDRRVLLGYHSGHFSLPAFRIDEVRQLVAETDSDVSNVLWLTATYLEPDRQSTPLVKSVVAKIPRLAPNHADAVAEALASRNGVEDLSWVENDRLGWINNGPYSQRNPQSRLGVLAKGDFAYIKQFFA